MQWDDSAGRGFSPAEPWLPYGRPDRNVAAQDDDPASLLNLYRRAIWLRKRTPVLLEGGYEELPSPPGTWLFARRADGAPVAYVAISTATEAIDVALPAAGSVILATDRDMEGRPAAARFTLPPLGAAIVLS